MVTNFEQYTAEVADKDLATVHYIAKRLKTNIGVKNQVTNKRIREKLAVRGVKVSDSKLRKFIQYIRQNNLTPMLCATSNGYYVAQTVQEFITYTESFEQRVNGMQFTLDAMKRQISNQQIPVN